MLEARAMVRSLQAVAARQPVMFQARQQAAARQPGADGFSSGPQPRSPAGHGTAVDFQEAQRLQAELLQVDALAGKGGAKPNTPCRTFSVCDVMPGNRPEGASKYCPASCCATVLAEPPAVSLCYVHLKFCQNAIQRQHLITCEPCCRQVSRLPLRQLP